MIKPVAAAFSPFKRNPGAICVFRCVAMIAAALVLSTQNSSLCYAVDKYEGKATNSAGDFNYGKVTFTVSGTTMKDLKIEGVTTSGCGGYKNVIVPKIKIRGTKFSAGYVPVPGLDDIVTVSGTIRNGKVTGIFAEGPLCQNDGKFTARKK